MNAETPNHRAFDLQLSEKLLLECVRAAPNHGAIENLLQRSAFTWEPFWSLASLQHVQPLVARTLAHPSLAACVPLDARQAMKAARMYVTLSNMATHAELHAIHSRLTDRGIPVIPLKGTHLAQRLFGSLDARRCGDIDILVKEEDWAAAHRALIEAGYQPAADVRPAIKQHRFHGVPLVRASNGQTFMVEIHRQLTDPRFMTIDYDTLWLGNALSCSASGALASLPNEELLVFLAIHAPKHDTGVLRLLADIDHLVASVGSALDWDRVVTLARSWQADTMLYFTLTLSSALLKTTVPNDALQAIRPPLWKRRAVPFLVGPRTIVQPPEPAHLRANRSRIAYCLMLGRNRRMLHSYWHYVIMPPRLTPENSIIAVTHHVRRAIDGVTWTALSVGSAFRDLVQTSKATHR